MDGRILILISLVSFAFVAGMYVEHKNNNTIVLDDKPDDENEVIFEKICIDIMFEIQKDIHNDVIFVQNDNVLQYCLVNSNYTKNTVLIKLKDCILNDSIYMYYDKTEQTINNNSKWNHSYSKRREITISVNNTGIIDNFNSSSAWS